MQPKIGEAIGQGFRAARRSWAGIGFFAGVWAGVALVAVIVFMLTSPPPEIFEQQAAAPTAEVAPVITPSAPIASATSSTDTAVVDVNTTLAAATDAAPADSTSAGAASDVAPTPAATPPPAVQAPAITPPPAVITRTPEALVREREVARNRVIGDWLLRVWPVLLLIVLWLIGMSTWVSGGQLAYLVKRVRGGEARVAEFWTTGRAVFPALLGASCLGLAIWFGFLLGVGLLIAVFVSLSASVAEWILIVTGLLLGLAVLAGLLWFSIRAALWFVAIVADRLGPMAGLRASFRLTRGREWKTFALLVVLTLISAGVNLAFRIPEALIGLAGEVPGAIATLVLFLPSAVAGLYVGFATMAAVIQFYGQCASSAGSVSGSPAGRAV